MKYLIKCYFYVITLLASTNPDSHKLTNVLQICKLFEWQSGFIYQWAHQWKMEFNSDPNMLLLVKKSRPNHLGHILEKITKAIKNIGLSKQFVHCNIICHEPSQKNWPPRCDTKFPNSCACACAVIGARDGLNRSQLNQKLGWETWSDRRMCSWILQLRKNMNN